jgi:serine/threonine-protein kinase ATR
MHEESDENETQQCEMLSAFARIACAATDCLSPSKEYPQIVDSEDWKNCMAAMLAITREPKFQASPKARVLMAVAIGRVFNHISDKDYLKLETCELGQWLLGSMSRSLRELKLAATWVSSGHWRDTY